MSIATWLRRRRWRRRWQALAESDPARLARRVTIAVAGSVLLVGGAAMVLLPGPGVLVMLAGLALMSLEFVWARRLLKRARVEVKAGEKKLRRLRARALR